MIKPETINRILEQANIEEVIKDYVKLDKKGSNFKGNCPFHDEKTPSFVVNPSGNYFNCFGCGKGGNSIKFLMLHENMDYVEALKHLAAKYNIEIEEVETTPEQKKKIDITKEVIKFYQFAGEYYRFQLLGNKVEYEYVQSRFNQESILKWEIGFAPDKWDSLTKAALKEGFKESVLLASELVRKSEKSNKLYDYFRNRVTFPIFDKTGRIIAFSGRDINWKKGDSSPKYINSPNHIAYKKSDVLYGLNYALAKIRETKTAIMVEGNPDVIKMHQLGITNAIAISGTSLSNVQIDLVKRFADNIVFILDGDAAGINALIKYGKETVKSLLDTYLLIIPGKKDPDEFFTSEKHYKIFRDENKIDFITWYGKRLFSTVQDPTAKNRVVVDVSKIIHYLPAKARTVYIDKLCEIKEFKLKAKLFNDELKTLDGTHNRSDEDHSLPKGVDPIEFRKWGFYEYKNCYFFQTKSGIEQISNFVMKPVFHIESKFESKRIYEIKNKYNFKQVVDMDMNEMTSLQAFQRNIESRGNFLFLGTTTHMNKIKMKLYEQTRTCAEIRNLGWQPAGFWAWSNGMINGSGFEPIDEFGIIKHKDINYYIPAFSNIYANDQTVFIDERKFMYIKRDVDLSEWASLLIKVYGDNAMIGISFWLASLFRDHILHLFSNFPILNLFGPKGSGKSQFAMSMSNLFGIQQTPFNIHNGTKPGLAEHLQLFKNGFAWIDEYKNNIEFDKIETLKSIYDAIGRSRMNMDRGKKKETTAVNAAAMLSGQEMPTADVALFSRVIFLQFKKSEFTPFEKANFDKLQVMQKQGLSHLTSDIIKHRKHFEIEYYNNYTQALADIDEALKGKPIEDRIMRNFVSIVAAYKTLEHLIKIPFTYNELINVAAEAIISQNLQVDNSNEVGMFWGMLETLYDENLITDKWHFMINTTKELKTTTGTRTFLNPTNILKFKFNSVYNQYAKHSRMQGGKPLVADTLRYYLQHYKHFLGVQRSVKFSIKERNDNGEWTPRTQTTSAFCFDYDKLKEFTNLTRDSYDPDKDENVPKNVNGTPNVDKEETLTQEELGF